MRRPCGIVAVAVFAACMAACGEQPSSGFGSTVTSYTAYGYAVEVSGVRTDGPRYLQRTETEIGNLHSPEDRLFAAIAWLLQEDHLPRGWVTYWAGACAPGQRVEAVEIRSGLIVVRLAGVVREPDRCALSASGRAVQQQQVAWTVRDNLDPFAEEEPPLVRVIEANGDTWEATADLSFIQPSRRPTN